MRRAPALAALALLGCTTQELRQALQDPHRTPPFIPDGLQRVVVDETGVRWQVLERRVFAAVSDAVDLWLQRADPDAPFGPPAFTGLVPSCLGRPRWVVNPDRGQPEGACFLRRFFVQGGEALFQLRLGGDWLVSVAVPLSEILNDDDGDGLNNATERLLGTRVDSADSDGDGLPDGQDPNPLVAEQGPLDAARDLEAVLVHAALARSQACHPGKPLRVVGPDRLRRSYPGLACTVLWRAPGALDQAARDPDSQAARDLEAREGGLSRVQVEVALGDRQRPVVVLGHRLGEERLVFSHGARHWEVVERRFQVIPDSGP